MQLQHLEYFCEVARHNSITKAAEVLYISQPALSKIIRNLETELGIDLFTRQGKTIKLNQNGRIFYDNVDKGLSCIYDGPRQIRALLNTHAEERVSICAFASTIGTCDLLSEVLKAHPEIHIDYNYINSDNMLKTRTCDMYLLSGTNPPPGMEGWELITEPMVLVVPKDHPLAKRESIDLAEAKDCGFIICDHGQVRSITYSSCTYAGFVPNVLFKTGDVFILKEFINAGAGVALVPQITWGTFNKENTAIVNIRVPSFFRTLLLCTWKDKFLSPAAQMVRDEIIAYYQKKAATELSFLKENHASSALNE